MTDRSPVDLRALRAAIDRIEAGEEPHHASPGSSPGAWASGDEPAPSWLPVTPAPATTGNRGGGAVRDPYAVAKAIVLRQLANSPKTRAQLASALAARECAPDVAEAVLDRLTEVGLIDDEAFAQVYVRSKQRSRGLATSALRRELRDKGVDADLAAEVLGAVSTNEEVERARALVRARLARLHGLDRVVQVRRLAGMLARKGYPAGLARTVIFEEVDQAAEHRRD